MEERKTIFDYIEQVFSIFGFSVIILNIFSRMFGEDAREISSLFSMGKEGLSGAVMLQFFSVAVWIVFLRFLFFTDIVIKSMRIVLRTLGMVLSVLVVIVVYIFAFDWFPANDWVPWAMFFACFGICFAISLFITALREKTENRKMEDALKKLKQEK